MKVLFWCVIGLSAMKAAVAATVRKRRRLRPYQVDAINRHQEDQEEEEEEEAWKTRSLERDIAEDFLRELEFELDGSFSMSMAPVSTEPLTEAPTSDATATPILASLVPSSTLPPDDSNSNSTTGIGIDEVRNLMIQEKCGVTTLERSRDILSILSFLSVPVNLITPDTPQFQARDWLDNVDTAIVCAEDEERIAQRYRASLLYFAMGGNEWFNCANETSCVEEDGTVAVPFLDERNECEWFGLDCGDNYNATATNPTNGDYFPITSIELKENNLDGVLFTELFGLLELDGIFLDGNLKIGGSIPEDISKLTKLRFIGLDNNNLVGTLPQSLYSMTELRAVDINNNQLAGNLSDAIGNLVNLELLRMENNLLSGPLPSDGLLQLERLGTNPDVLAYLFMVYTISHFIVVCLG